ncbi:sigma-70 family RNA polymerase sigma factor [Phytohabitans houttuyneae]|uniref:RNA polymerase sigma factor n=1 Tax=Phytohabitans houttuyneae TaxID=1076126 RepID=A0A6V8KL02_9ACTN|nr:sigma-70 family RNA polymerase sigma factor [Phytohabitans houttuyneae]GFJ84110.1 RNA polymerase sigma factor [Phytohabitans houttuyneae]
MTDTRTEAPGDFTTAAEPLRRELLAHCYRMLGSVADAEDAVQETYLRAWRAYDRFEGRASVRSWLYRIATNTCLTALERRERRALPSGLGGPAADPAAPLAADQSVAWLQPVPDALVAPSAQDPGEIVASRESMRLALVASLQYLPARQRAVLILRDVLAFSAAEVAEILDTTVAAVKSTLQRARGRLDEVAPARDDVAEPSEPERRALLDRYIEAIENADPEALRRLLHDDLVLEATPQRTWYAGVATCLPFLVRHVFGAGRWRMVPTGANGQPAVVAYVDGGDGVYRAYGVVVLTVAAGGIRRINAFGEPGLAAAFGCPSELG